MYVRETVRDRNIQREKENKNKKIKIQNSKIQNSECNSKQI